MENSLYIHIPFCGRKCFYCDFYSTVYDRKLSKEYVDTIISQLNGMSNNFTTVYIGGGTPSVLDAEDLGRLLKAVKPKLGEHFEFTVEANPDSFDDRRIKILMDSGVNRLSIGVQSLDQRKLKKLGRLHNVSKARESVYLAAKKGISNISIDLMFGIWDEAQEDWRRELEEAVKLPVKHISCYSLTYEKNTPLFKALQNKSIRPLGDDQMADMYETAIELLALRGFKQYEISNFAIKGFECRHNMSYWENNPYVGLGASAVSYSGGVRAKNIADVREYIKRYENGTSLIDSSEKLSPIKRAKETAAVKIRTREGIDFKWFKESTGHDFQKLERAAIEDLLRKDLIKYKRSGDINTGIALRRRGFVFCDTVSSTLL